MLIQNRRSNANLDQAELTKIISHGADHSEGEIKFHDSCNPKKNEKNKDETHKFVEEILPKKKRDCLTTVWPHRSLISNGTYQHLQAAIASIDDRLLFMRICEELEARGISYKSISVESFVGGNVLRIADISTIPAKYAIECEDFSKNLLHCNIRLNLPDGSSQLECTFINPPLVPDFGRSHEEVETDMQKPHTYVLEIGQRSMPQSQVIARNIEERILTYCHIYIPVRKFADAYAVYYRNYCNIRAFTYHKLVLAYGDHRELLFVLYWRWNWQQHNGKYALCFGQLPELVPQEKQIKMRSCSNPHVLINHLLTEHFNRDKDLTWLVNYLVNTHRSLSIIQNFVRNQIHSTKTAAQLLGKEAAFPAEFMFYLVPLDEHTIRLCYGPQIAMEFMLLQDNQVAIRDCSVVTDHSSCSSGVSLTEFWRSFQQSNDNILASTPTMPGTSAATTTGNQITRIREETRIDASSDGAF